VSCQKYQTNSKHLDFDKLPPVSVILVSWRLQLFGFPSTLLDMNTRRSVVFSHSIIEFDKSPIIPITSVISLTCCYDDVPVGEGE
jgi:hypothetical protein